MSFPSCCFTVLLCYMISHRSIFYAFIVPKASWIFGMVCRYLFISLSLCIENRFTINKHFFLGWTWVVFSLALVGKFFITGSYNILYLVSSEVFPTCIRSRGLNLSSTMARLSSILSPFIIQLAVRDVFPSLFVSLHIQKYVKMTSFNFLFTFSLQGPDVLVGAIGVLR